MFDRVLDEVLDMVPFLKQTKIIVLNSVIIT